MQADAHFIYDALFKGIPPDAADGKPGDCGPPPTEVGCFSHARRKYWEAAVCKHPLGLRGVRLIAAFFDADNKRPERGLVATAVGYCVRHEPALRRFLDDGRLRT